MRPAVTSSSAITATPGASRARAARMISSDSWSAIGHRAAVGLGLDPHARPEVSHLHATGGQDTTQKPFREALDFTCVHQVLPQ